VIGLMLDKYTLVRTIAGGKCFVSDEDM